MTFLLFTMAQAAPIESLLALDPQPLASQHAFTDMFVGLCGEVEWSDTARMAERTEFGAGGCDGMYLAEDGRFSIRFLDADEVGTRDDRTGEQERDLLNVEDRELLESLGFDPSELGYSFTRDIVVESQDEETGASKRSYLGTLTVVERAFGDYWVPGSRLSVVRDARGELLELIGAWPEVDMDTDLRDADEPGTREEYASLLGVEAEAIIGLRAALEPTGVTEAHVVGARTVTYVTWRVPGPEGSTAAIGVYFEGATPLWSEE